MRASNGQPIAAVELWPMRGDALLLAVGHRTAASARFPLRLRRLRPLHTETSTSSIVSSESVIDSTRAKAPLAVELCCAASVHAF